MSQSEASHSHPAAQIHISYVLWKLALSKTSKPDVPQQKLIQNVNSKNIFFSSSREVQTHYLSPTNTIKPIKCSIQMSWLHRVGCVNNMCAKKQEFVKEQVLGCAYMVL